jgi:opacity protein-like surface antigen
MNLQTGWNKSWVIGLACVAMAQLARAGTEMNQAPAPDYGDTKSMMQVHTEVRDVPKTGLSVGIFGGVNAFQSGDFHLTAPGTTINGSTKDSIGAVAGIHLENTWPSFAAIGSSDPSEPQLLMPAMALDLFWMGNRYRAADDAGDSLRADINSFTFIYMPKLKFNLGIFRPYIGLGVGGTYTDAGNASVNTPGGGAGLNGSDNDFNFTAAGSAGAEIFVANNVSFDLDYRYIYVLDPTFHGNVGGTPVTYKVNDLGNHLLTLGLNYYF